MKDRIAMKTVHKWHFQLLCITFLVAILCRLCASPQQNTFSVEGLQLGVARDEILKQWKLAEASKSDDSILCLERRDDENISVVVYLRDSAMGSAVGDSLEMNGNIVKIGDAQASVRKSFGPPDESSVYPAYKGRREATDVYRSDSVEGQKVIARIHYSQERVVQCFLTYADCESVLDP